MKLTGITIGDVEHRHQTAAKALRGGRRLSTDQINDLIADLDDLIADHHDLRVRIARATMALDGRWHSDEKPDRVLLYPEDQR